jgi:hypothetical protein
MKKLIRRLLLGGALVWAVKTLGEKKAEGATRPAEEIRARVRENLPEAVNEETRQKIADKVVEVVKGPVA